jgi:hypothetical protein
MPSNDEDDGRELASAAEAFISSACDQQMNSAVAAKALTLAAGYITREYAPSPGDRAELLTLQQSILEGFRHQDMLRVFQNYLAGELRGAEKPELNVIK